MKARKFLPPDEGSEIESSIVLINYAGIKES
jgi:hypothetical protein